MVSVKSFLAAAAAAVISTAACAADMPMPPPPQIVYQPGLTYNVNNNLKIDFSWRYLNLGLPQTAVVQCQNTAACPSAFYTLKDMTSQDFRIGFRWMIQPNAGIGAMAGAQPVFAPQPEYVPAPQPPLSS